MTTVQQLVDAAGIERAGVVRWGERVPLDGPGVYIVATAEGPDVGAAHTTVPIDHTRVEELIRVCTEAMVDGARASVESLTDRLLKMWVLGEPVLYIGRASKSVRRRTNDFYRTPIGARRPHAGGWPIQMIDRVRSPLWVHYAATDDPAEAEVAMVRRFAAGVSEEALRLAVDPVLPIPFANLEMPDGQRKKHGLRRVKVGMSQPNVERCSSGDGSNPPASPRSLSRDDRELKKRVDSKIAEFDAIGRDAFLSKYCWEKARSFFILAGGKHYDSKAVLGAARGIKCGPSAERSALNGGSSGAVKVLRRLGYVVEKLNPTAAGRVKTLSPSSPNPACETCFMELPTNGVCPYCA